LADNTRLNVGAGGDVIATDDISDVKYQRVKLIHGADGTNDGDVQKYNGLPVHTDLRAQDAFGRARVSNPTTLFESATQYNKHRLYWEETLAGSATSTHSTAAAAVTLAVTASASDSVERQTRAYHRYEPGKAQLIYMSGNMKAAVAGVDKRIGYFDDDNGAFFEQNGTTALNVVIRSKVSGSVVNTKVAQASWNIDVMDGTGVSGHTLDISKVQIFLIDIEWLGVGSVRFGFIHEDEVHYVHEFRHANQETTTYMGTANLPCRYEIDNTTGANTADMLAICTAVISEGGVFDEIGSPFSATNGTTTRAVPTGWGPMLSIRPKQTFNSVTNRGLIRIEDVVAYALTQACAVRVIYGATLTNASFTSVSDDSIVEYDVSATALSGGIDMTSFFVERQGGHSIPHETQYPIFLNAAGSHPTSPYTDSVTIAMSRLSSATNATTSISWNEIR
jgi:hypothetical protein